MSERGKVNHAVLVVQLYADDVLVAESTSTALWTDVLGKIVRESSPTTSRVLPPEDQEPTV